jgi:hypothetical protein
MPLYSTTHVTGGSRRRLGLEKGPYVQNTAAHLARRRWGSRQSLRRRGFGGRRWRDKRIYFRSTWRKMERTDVAGAEQGQGAWRPWKEWTSGNGRDRQICLNFVHPQQEAAGKTPTMRALEEFAGRKEGRARWTLGMAPRSAVRSFAALPFPCLRIPSFSPALTGHEISSRILCSYGVC